MRESYGKPWSTEKRDEMNPEKRNRMNARHELSSLMYKISNECYDAGWMHNQEFDLWKYVQDYRMTGSLDCNPTFFKYILDRDVPILSALASKAGGWFGYGVDNVIFLDQGRWFKIYAIFCQNPELAQKSIENYDKNLPWRKKEAKLTNSKWYRWRNKLGKKYERKQLREQNRSWKNYYKYGIKYFDKFASIALPLVRRMNYQEIGKAVLHIEPLP